MDILTPGLRGLLRNRRSVRNMSDYYLGRFSSMFEGWARRDARKIFCPDLGTITPEEARIHAQTSYHHGRLAMLCYREHVRRERLK